MNEYELRQYSASSWMSTNTAGVDYSKASSTNFMRLFRYISGTNTDSRLVDMLETLRSGLKRPLSSVRRSGTPVNTTLSSPTLPVMTVHSDSSTDTMKSGSSPNSNRHLQQYLGLETE
ncbi:uncharacterized protein [Magallana gigas]|uniref:uncharacterized protein n=1 Tax=Magallana gigas TaxID=29159 RepID=UPI00334288B4